MKITICMYVAWITGVFSAPCQKRKSSWSISSYEPVWFSLMTAACQVSSSIPPVCKSLTLTEITNNLHIKRCGGFVQHPCILLVAKVPSLSWKALFSNSVLKTWVRKAFLASSMMMKSPNLLGKSLQNSYWYKWMCCKHTLHPLSSVLVYLPTLFYYPHPLNRNLFRISLQAYRKESNDCPLLSPLG